MYRQPYDVSQQRCVNLCSVVESLGDQAVINHVLGYIYLPYSLLTRPMLMNPLTYNVSHRLALQRLPRIPLIIRLTEIAQRQEHPVLYELIIHQIHLVQLSRCRRRAKTDIRTNAVRHVIELYRLMDGIIAVAASVVGSSVAWHEGLVGLAAGERNLLLALKALHWPRRFSNTLQSVQSNRW